MPVVNMEEESEHLNFNPKAVHTPSDQDVQKASITQFMDKVSLQFKVNLKSYEGLYQWSLQNVEQFWMAVWEHFDIIHSGEIEFVLEHDRIADLPSWFGGVQLNYAENALRWTDQDRIAVIATGESMKWEKQMSYAELRQSVFRLATYLRDDLQIHVGDTVVGYVPNCVEAVIAFLACASIGAIWSAASCDFGVTAVLDRFIQIQPKVIFSVNAVVYNNKTHDNMKKLGEICAGLQSSLKCLVLIDFVAAQPPQTVQLQQQLSSHVKIVEWKSILNTPASQNMESFSYARVPFGHPLYILYSSGTTGQPKCITHGHGGPLLQHLKEHVLHSDMRRDDVFFQFTTTGWMMWNWLVSGLLVGCTIVLYDGSPFIPDGYALFQLCENYKVSRFGTSAKFIQSCQDMKVHPLEKYPMQHLKTIFSTGSPLLPHNYDFILEQIKPNIQIASITGGTDIVSLFAGNCCILPVYRGEIQCRCLGMAVESWTDNNSNDEQNDQSSDTQIIRLPINGSVSSVQGLSGDLVCTKPFPCMPVKFWGDDAQNSKYGDAYFSQYQNVWYHGDYVWINPVTKGVIMLGRSDGILKPAGVRFGSAELYNVVEKQFKVEVADSLAIGQRRHGDTDERVVLFLKLNPGQQLTDDLRNRIKAQIRTQLSPRHVPAFILPIDDIPYTVNGKKVEVAVKKILNGQSVTPSATLANPESLVLYKNIKELQ
ncbi:hypothetical protein MIR68_007277 [Amoeboaphelidium protococcarum]|nr:hypothetical protein MIR68_007277 [Amoeboaphelidium protococcarum]